MFFYLKSVNPAGHLLERHSVLMKEAGEGDPVCTAEAVGMSA